MRTSRGDGAPPAPPNFKFFVITWRLFLFCFRFQGRSRRPSPLTSYLSLYQSLVTTSAGILFLFDRKTVRFFRKDGHNWQKKKDGKTVRETHEKLKVGNVELLNCYYAHAAEDTKFQRRCYWLLNSDEGVVLVHYLHVTVKAHAEAHAIGMSHANSGINQSPVAPPRPIGGGFGGVHRVRSGGNIVESPDDMPGWQQHQLAPQQFYHGSQGHQFQQSHAHNGFHGHGSHDNIAAAAAHEYRGDESSWFIDNFHVDGIENDGYEPKDDADLDFFLRDDGGMDIGDANDAHGIQRTESEAFGYGILRDFVHQEAIAGNGNGNGTQRRVSETLSLQGGDTEFGVAVAAAAGVGGDGGALKTLNGQAMEQNLGPAAAAAAAATGPDFGTSFPVSDAIEAKVLSRGPSRGPSSQNDLRLVQSMDGTAEGAGSGSNPRAVNQSASNANVIPGSFEDGVRTMRDLESRAAELQRSLTTVANVTADEARGQLSRLEQDMSALEHGHRAMARADLFSHRGHRRRESVDRRVTDRRPVRWDNDDDSGDGGADKEDDDGDDDDDEDAEGVDGPMSSLAKAAAATRRPTTARDGGSANGREHARAHRTGYAPGPDPGGSEMDLTDMDDGDDPGTGGPRSPSPAAAAAQLRAAAAAAHQRGSRGNHRARPVVPRNLTGAQILWEIVDFSPEWDGESGGSKVIVSGAPRPGWPEGMHLCCVFGSVEVPAEQISPGTLRCRAPPHAPGRVPFYISCLGSGKRPVSDIRTFEYREAGLSNARDRRAAEVRLATGVTERDFQLRLVHLMIGADRSSVKGSGGGNSGSGSGGGNNPGNGTGSNGGSGGSGGNGDVVSSSGATDGVSSPSSGNTVPPKNAPQNPGASFVRKTLAQLALPGDSVADSDNLSDEDVARAFKTALDARLRHTISTEAKSKRLAGASGVVGASGVGVGPTTQIAMTQQQMIPKPDCITPRSAYERVDAGGVGIIHCVAALGMNWAIPALCKSGCDVNQPDRRRRTALHWAAAKGHEDTVATLLASGANIRATARWGAGGYTAADLAAALGHGGIAAYISETSLAASLSNISLYGGPQGAARRFRVQGSGLGADRTGPIAGFQRGALQMDPALAGVSSPMIADVSTPVPDVADGKGVRPLRFARNRQPPAIPHMRSLLLATETEVTGTDFDSRTDITDLETDAGELVGETKDETNRERTAAGMIQLAFRKHATRRRKLRRKQPAGQAPNANTMNSAPGGLGSVQEIAEMDDGGQIPKTQNPKTVASDSDDEEPDEDVKRNVKKVVKKAEKAAMKITSSIRSLKTSKERTQGEDPGLGKRVRGGNNGSAASRVDEPKETSPPIDRSPSEEAVAEVERRIQELQHRAILLQDQARATGRASVGGAPRRRVPAGDIMRLVKVSGLAGSQGKLEALHEDEIRREKISRSPRSSPSRPSGKMRDSGDIAAGSGASGSIAGRGTDDDDDDDDDDDARAPGGNPASKLRSVSRKAKSNTKEGDDSDDDEEDAKVAVERIQAIIRSRRAREQYLRLRSVTMSLQERIAARARGEIPMGGDGDGDDIEVEDEEDDE